MLPSQEMITGVDKDSVSGILDQRLEPQTFDYGALAPEAADVARRSAERIRGFHRDAIIKSGIELLEVKKAVGHGHFTEWVAAELNFSATTARNYMRAAAAFGDKAATVAVLPPAVLYTVAAASPLVWREVVRRIEAGEQIGRAAAHEIIIRHKQAEAEEKRLAMLTTAGRQKDAAAKERAQAAREKRAAKERREKSEHFLDVMIAADDLIDHLSSYYTDAAILHLDALWRTSEHTLTQRLTELRAVWKEDKGATYETESRKRRLKSLNDLREEAKALPGRR